MLPEIWAPQLTVVFVGTAVTELSVTLGFYHLHPRNRFWELLELGGITPGRVITAQERKALTEGHARGTLSDPVRSMFVQKKTSQLLRLGIGLTDVNRRVVALSEKDKAAQPSQEDIAHFIAKVGELKPKMLAFAVRPDAFVEMFKNRYSGASEALGLQPFRIDDSEVWLLGSTSASTRGVALSSQEDTFFVLGERISAITRGLP
jgi:G:T/U-mismatch repair DNA glycosylase